MKIKGPLKIRSRFQARLNGPSAARRLARACGVALALGALWMLAASCLAAEPPAPAQSASPAFCARGIAGSELDGNHLYDLVMVERKGRGPQGFRFQIVLDSAARGAESWLELAAAEGGLLVTARDVDGMGNDLDLIVKSANSFTPLGVWINNHHGGFTKVDASVYASSIWADSPLMVSLRPTENFQGAISLGPQSFGHLSAQQCPGERWTLHALVDPAGLEVLSRLTSDPQHTRGPPSPPFTNS